MGTVDARRLRVVMEATAIPARLTGAGVYATRLTKALGERSDVSMTALTSPQGAAGFAAPGVAVHPVAVTGAGRAARIAFTLALSGVAARCAGGELFHGVHHELPLLGGRPAVVTIHDLTMLTHPEWHEPLKVAYFRRSLQWVARRADRLLCVSRYTADDVVNLLGVDPSRVDVTPLGCAVRRATDEDVVAVCKRLGLHRPYVLGLGTLEPRKGLPGLIRAWACLARMIPHDLVLAGLAGWGTAAVAEALAGTGVDASRIRVLGYVPEADKAALFTGASVFVYPSHAEGFGLPVLEAMACKTPVVTTTGGALREVAGDGALLVAPADEDALATAIASSLEPGPQRDALIERGARRAAARTWSACAEATANAYRHALERNA